MRGRGSNGGVWGRASTDSAIPRGPAEGPAPTTVGCFPTAVGCPPTAIGYPPTTVGYLATAGPVNPEAAIGYPSTAVGYPPTAVGCPRAAIGYPSTAVSYPPIAVGYPPTTVGCSPAGVPSIIPVPEGGRGAMWIFVHGPAHVRPRYTCRCVTAGLTSTSGQGITGTSKGSVPVRSRRCGKYSGTAEIGTAHRPSPEDLL